MSRSDRCLQSGPAIRRVPIPASSRPDPVTPVLSPWFYHPGVLPPRMSVHFGCRACPEPDPGRGLWPNDVPLAGGPPGGRVLLRRSFAVRLAVPGPCRRACRQCPFLAGRLPPFLREHWFTVPKQGFPTHLPNRREPANGCVLFAVSAVHPASEGTSSYGYPGRVFQYRDSIAAVVSANDFHLPFQVIRPDWSDRFLRFDKAKLRLETESRKKNLRNLSTGGGLCGGQVEPEPSKARILLEISDPVRGGACRPLSGPAAPAGAGGAH